MYRINLKYRADQLVFLDESSFDRRTPGRRYGWAPRGQRAYAPTHFVRGTRYAYLFQWNLWHPHSQIVMNLAVSRYSVLPAMSLSGILAVDIREGSFTKASFKEFVEKLLTQMQNYPKPNSVIIMDNCRIHKSQEVLDMITRACVLLLSLFTDNI